MKKKMICWLLILCMLAAQLPAAVFAESVLQIRAETVEAKAGETVTVPIRLENNPGVAGVTFELACAPSLTVTAVSRGDALADLDFLKPDISENPMTFSWDGLDADASNGVLAYVTFRVAPDAAEGTRAVELIEVPSGIYDADMEDVEAVLVSGGVVVVPKTDVSDKLSFEGATFVYDGTEKVHETAVMTDASLAGTITYTYEGDRVHAGTFTVTASYADDNAYGLRTVECTILPAQGQNLTEELTVRYDDTAERVVEIAALLPDAGTIGTANAAASHGAVQIVSAENGKLVFRLADGLTAEDAGRPVTVAVLFTSRNYEESIYTLTVQITGKTDVSDKILFEGAEFVADGTEKAHETAVMADPSLTGSFTYTYSGDRAKPGTFTVTAVYEDADHMGSKTVTCTITAPPAAIWADSAAVKTGETVTVPIRLENNPGFAGVGIRLSYDEGLTVAEIRRGDALQRLDFTQPSDLTANPLLLSWDGMDEDDTDGVLVYVTFRAERTAQAGTYPVELTAVAGAIYDGNMDDVDVILEGGTVSVTQKVDVSDKILFPNGTSAYTGKEKSFETARMSDPALTGTITYAYSGDRVNAGTFTVTATYEDADHYGVYTAQYFIGKQQSWNGAGETTLRYDNTQVYTIDLGVLDPGVMNAEVLTAAFGTGELGQVVSANGSKVTYRLKDGLTAEAVGKSDVLTVTFDSRNFEQNVYTLRLNVFGKSDVSDKILFENGTAEYDGKEKTHETAVMTDPSLTGTLTYIYSGDRVNVGTFTVTAIYEDADHYGQKTVTFTVTAPPPVIYAETAAVKTGETVTVPIRLKNNPGLAGVSLYLTYGSGLVVEAVERGDAVPGLDFTAPKDLTANPLILNLDGMDEDGTDGVLVYVTFRAARDASAGTYPVELATVAGGIYDGNMDDVEVILEHGAVSVTKKVDVSNRIVFPEAYSAYTGETVVYEVAKMSDPSFTGTFTYIYEGDRVNAGMFTVTAIYEDADHYGTYTTQYFISKNHQWTGSGEVSRRYDNTEAYSIDLGTLDPGVMNTKVLTAAFAGNAVGQVVSAAGTTVTYRLKDGLTVESVGSSDVLTVTFDSRNFEHNVYTLRVKVFGKNDVSDKILFENGTAEYDGKEKTHETAVMEDAALTGTITYIYEGDRINVGTFTVTAVYEDADNYGQKAVTFTVTAPPVVPEIRVDAADVKTGGTVVVPIRLKDNTGLAGIGLQLTYAKGLTVTQVTRGDAVPGLDFTAPKDLTANPLKLNWDGIDADDTAGVLVYITFRADRDAAEGAYPVQLTAVAGSIYDNDMNDVDVILENGVVNVTKKADVSDLIIFPEAISAYTGETMRYEGATMRDPSLTGSFTYTYEGDRVNAGSFNVTAIYEDADHYGTYTTRYVIAKNVKWTGSGEVSRRYDNTGVYTLDLSDLDPAVLEAGVLTAAFAGNEVGQVVSAKGTAVTYRLKDGLTADSVGKSDVLTVTFDSRNFEQNVYTLRVNVFGKDDVSDKIVFPDGAAEYDGTEKRHENASMADASLTGTITYIYEGDRVNVGSFTVTAVYEDVDYYGRKTATFTITAPPILPEIWVESAAAKTGGTVVVPIRLKDNSGLAGISLKLTYAEGLTITKVARGDAVPGLDFTKPGNLNDNPLTLSWDGIEADETNGVLLYLTIKVAADAEEGDYPIELTAIKGGIYDNDMNDVRTTVVSGTLTVTKKTDVSDKIVFPDSSSAYTGKAVTYEGASMSDPALAGSFTYTYSGDRTNVGSFTVTAIYEDEENLGSKTAAYHITKAAGAEVRTEMAIRYGDIKEKVLYPAELLQDAQQITCVAAVADSTLLQVASCSGDRVVYSLAKGLTDADVGKMAEIKVRFTSRNYEESTCVLTVMVMDKTDVSGKISFQNGTSGYSGMEKTHETAVMTDPALTGTITYVYEGDRVNEGTFTVTAIYEDMENKGSKTVTYTITPVPMFGAETISAKRGETVTLPIWLRNNPGLAGVGFKLAYAEGLTITKVVRGDAVPGLDFTKPGNLSMNPIVMAWDGIDADETDGVLLYVTFRVDESAASGLHAVIPVYMDGYCYDNDMNDVEVLAKGGGIFVKHDVSDSIRFAGESLTYDGSQKVCETAAMEDPSFTGTITYSYSGDRVNAGAFTVTATYEDDQRVGSKTVTCTIAPAVLHVTGGSAARKVYDGTRDASVTGVSFAGLAGADTVDYTVVYAEFADADAGTEKSVKFSVQLAASEKNYVLETAAGMTQTHILKRDPAVSVSVTGGVYTGSAFETAAVVFSNAVAGEQVDYAVSYENNVNAGLASVTVSCAETGNYTFTAVQKFFIIEKASVELPAAQSGLVYNGQRQIGVSAPEGAVYTLTGNAGTDAGSYKTTVSLIDPANYKWKDLEENESADRVISWSIAHKPVDADPAVAVGLIYTGKNLTALSGVPGQYTVTGGSAIHAGSYTAVAVLAPNYCWKDGSTTEKQLPWIIEKAAAPVLQLSGETAFECRVSGEKSLAILGIPADTNGTEFALGAVKDETGILESCSVTGDGTILFTLKGMQAYKPNVTAVLPVTVTMKNYHTVSVEAVISLFVIADSVALDQSEVTLEENGTATLTASAEPAGITEFIWTTDNPVVATVENGVVTAMAPGMARITVTAPGGVYARCNVIVEAGDVGSGLRITVGTAITYPEGVVTVPVRLENNPGLAGVLLELTHSDSLKLISVIPGDAVPGLDFTPPGDLNAEGLVLNWDGVNADATSGVLVQLVFRTDADVEEGAHHVTLTYGPGSIYDDDMQDVEARVISGGVTVKYYIPGDINGDFVISNKDVTALRRHIAGGYDVAVVEPALDVNRDGVVSNKDVTTLRRYIAGGYDIEIK